VPVDNVTEEEATTVQDEPEEPQDDQSGSDDVGMNRPERTPIEERYLANLEQARIAPPGTPVPTRGIGPRLNYLLWTQGYGGRNFVVPALGRKEQKEWEMKRAEEQLLIEELISLSNHVQRVLTILNSKGGVGKSPLAANLATVLYYGIEANTGLVDVNENDGTTCFWMGVNRWETSTLRYGLRHPNEFSSYRKVTSRMSRSPMPGNAVRVMGSDPTDTSPFTTAEIVQLLYTLMQSFHSLVNDGGNGNKHPGNEGAAIAATDLVFPAMAGDQQSFERVLSTMTNFLDPVFEDKVKSSFIAVNATRPTDTLDDIMEMLKQAVAKLNKEKRDLSDTQLQYLPEGEFTLDTFGIGPERVSMLHFDPYIAAKKPAHALSLHIDTRIAYLKLLVNIFRQGAPTPDLGGYLLRWREQQDQATQADPAHPSLPAPADSQTH
jgi:Mrp family chromosome partitioning ATPase